MNAERMTVDVPQSVLDDLKDRLRRTRWPKPVPKGGGWEYGTDTTYLRELVDYWLRELPKGERKCFEVAVRVYPEAVHLDEISEETNYKLSSRNTYLRQLKARQLITEPERGYVRAADELF